MAFGHALHEEWWSTLHRGASSSLLLPPRTLMPGVSWGLCGGLLWWWSVDQDLCLPRKETNCSQTTGPWAYQGDLAGSEVQGRE